MTSPFRVIASTKDDQGGMVLTVGLDPNWADGFVAGVQAVVGELLAANEPESDK